MLVNTRASYIVLLILLAACDSRTSSAGSLIRAANGGRVETATHSIEIPAASLAQDTTVRLETAPASGYPALEGSRSEVLRLEPAGTVLSAPAAVTIDSAFVAASAGEIVTAWQLLEVDGAPRWSPIESSLDTETGDLRTSVGRFEPLAVVVRAAPTAGEIRGTLRWGDGSPVASAPVQLLQGGSPLTSTQTDATGAFSFADLSPGSYTIQIDYECTISMPVELVAGTPVDLMLTLCGT